MTVFIQDLKNIFLSLKILFLEKYDWIFLLALKTLLVSYRDTIIWRTSLIYLILGWMTEKEISGKCAEPTDKSALLGTLGKL